MPLEEFVTKACLLVDDNIYDSAVKDDIMGHALTMYTKM